MSLTALIVNEQSRDAMRSAEATLASPKPLEPLMSISLALAIELHDRHIVVDFPTLGHLYSRGSEDRDATRAINNLRDVTKEIQIQVGLLRFGIDTVRYDAYRAIAPKAYAANRGDPTYFGGKSDATPDEVRFCYDFVLETILDLQERDLQLQDVINSPSVRRRLRRR